MEGSAPWLHHVLGDAHLEHSVPIHDIDTAPIVNENPGEPDIDVGSEECRIHN